jgi:hypothetical protein
MKKDSIDKLFCTNEHSSLGGDGALGEDLGASGKVVGDEGFEPPTNSV